MEAKGLVFEGKVAVITGAAGRVGRALSRQLSSEGCQLVLVDSNTAGLSNIKNELDRTEELQHTTVECDLEQPGEAASRVRSSVDRLGRCDILVNNAAFVGTSSLEGWATQFEEQSVATFSRALQVNLTSAFALSQCLSQYLRETGDGRIVNIGSIYGVTAPDFRIYEGTSLSNPAAYACSKAGLIQLTKWLATALAPEVRVNAVSPGGIEAGQPEVFVEAYCSRTPLNRMARVEDVVGAVLYLTGPASAYVTAQNLVVDGGWTAW